LGLGGFLALAGRAAKAELTAAESPRSGFAARRWKIQWRGGGPGYRPPRDNCLFMPAAAALCASSAPASLAASRHAHFRLPAAVGKGANQDCHRFTGPPRLQTTTEELAHREARSTDGGRPTIPFV
jgi:hypothetical protein